MALHFIGFKDDRYLTAVRAFGQPDFIHRHWDARAKFGGERSADDVLIFADGNETAPITEWTFNDSERW